MEVLAQLVIKKLSGPTDSTDQSAFEFQQPFPLDYVFIRLPRLNPTITVQ